MHTKEKGVHGCGGDRFIFESKGVGHVGKVG